MMTLSAVEHHDSKDWPPLGPSDKDGDPQAVLTMLTTEHFTLQGARANTVSESTARATLYVGSLSASLVALGLLGQGGQRGHSFGLFVLLVLPTLYALGTFTFVRVAQCSIEDLAYGRAINRIRSYYRERAGAQARYFVMAGHDDVAGVAANMGITRPSLLQLYFTLAGMIEVLNGIVGAGAIAFSADALGIPMAAAASVGALTGVASILVSQRWQRHLHVRAAQDSEVLFPSEDRTQGRDRQQVLDRAPRLLPRHPDCERDTLLK
jgi:hypothetical protein